MANINDYLLWRGDIPINSSFKFNEIDSMILARFSYLRFDKIKLKNKETIESISKRMKELENEEFLYNGDKELIVTDYVKNTNKEKEKQFGAVTIHISDSQLYISYIGTDSTINGWKEDFNMAFMENVPCQVAGRDYLEKVAVKYPDKKIRIGGHSKGGNVAIYSAITAQKNVQNRIVKVDNYDGPGFSKEMIKKYADNKTIKKIETFIPQDSIIGRILNHKEKTSISLSIEKGLYQHDIYSWQVLKDEMIKSEKNTEASENINKTITDWLETTTNEQRKIFIDSLFELFYSTEVDTFGDISKSLGTSIPKILQKYKEISQEDKKTMTSMLKVFAKSYINVIKETGTLKFQSIKERYKNEEKNKKEKKYLIKLKK